MSAAVTFYECGIALFQKRQARTTASLKVAQAASDGLDLSSSYFGLDELVLSRTEPSRTEPWQQQLTRSPFQTHES
jgi:hypothetical protein